MNSTSCIFCSITQHTVPAAIVYEDDLVMAILDNDPISEAHMLILPKGDIKDIFALSEEQGARVFQVAQKCAKALDALGIYDGIRLMENNGRIQDVPHFHLHVFGCNQEQDIQIIYPSQRPITPQAQKELLQKLQRSFA